jgi:hypothetical protein
MSEAQSAPRSLVARARELAPHTDELIASVVLALVFIATYRRLSYGVDPRDEAFALAITQRFALGDRPYLDELNLRQTAGLLTTPFYWLYLKLHGSTDGIVHFMRLLYLGVQSLVAWSVFVLAERRVPRSYAMVAAAMPLTFVPFGMPVANYNGLGALLFTLGVFTVLRALLDDPSRKAMILAGACNALACIAYPPLAVPVTLVAASTLVLPLAEVDTRPRWRRTLDFVIGLALVGVPFLFVLVPGLPGVKKAFDYESMTTRARTMDKVHGILAAVLRLSPAHPSSLATLGVAGALAARSPGLRKAVFAFLVLFLAYYWSDVLPDARAQVPASVLTVHLSIYLGLLAGFFACFVPRGGVQRSFVLAAWLPSVVAGLLMAASSDNTGCMNGGLGLFAASVLAMVAAPMGVEGAAGSAGALGPVQRACAVAVMAVLPLAAMAVNAGTTYSDGPIVDGMSVVHVGPFRGLRGEAQKVARVEELTRVLEPLAKPGDGMLSYYDFPGAYLMTGTRPGLQTVWTDSRARLGPLLPYWSTRRTGNGVVLVIAGMPKVSPELEALAEVPSRLIADHGWFRVYREPPP